MTETENCKDGKPHDWKINENDSWTDTAIEDGELIVTVRYHAETRLCSKCKKFEIIRGNVVTRSGSEFVLEKDGTWGMGIT